MKLGEYKIDQKWYMVEVFRDGDWDDLVAVDLTLKEARKELCHVNCYGHRARIVQRIAGFKVVSEKDFRLGGSQ